MIIGSGGHGREIAEIAEHAHQTGQGPSVLGFLDEDSARHGQQILGYPVLGGLSWLGGRRQEVVVVIGIGDNATRQRVARQLGETVDFATVISPLAHLSKTASVGSGTVIFPGVVVSNLVTVGAHVQLNVGVSVSHDCRIGDFCSLYPGARATGGVILESGVMLGTNASVNPYRKVGHNSRIGTGACVVKDIPDGVTAVGVPAKPL